MNTVYKPAGYPSVSVYLVVERGQDLIAFMQQVFGAVETRRYDNDDGSIMHAEVRVDFTEGGPAPLAPVRTAAPGPHSPGTRGCAPRPTRSGWGPTPRTPSS